MSALSEYIKKIPAPVLILIGVLLAIFIGALDYATKDYFFLIFYIIPVVLVASFAGRNSGFFMAFVAAAVALVLDIVESPTHSALYVHSWNFIMALCLFAGIVHYLVKIKDAMAAAESAEVNCRLIIDKVNDAIIVRDTKTYRIVDVNDAACKMFSYAKEEMIGLDFSALIADDYNVVQVLHHVAAVVRGEPYLFEWLAKDKFGRTFWAETNMRRALIGGKYMLLAVSRDITERKLALDNR